MLYCSELKEYMVLYCSQETKTGALLQFSSKRKPMLYCSCFQEKGTGAQLFLGQER